MNLCKRMTPVLVLLALAGAACAPKKPASTTASTNLPEEKVGRDKVFLHRKYLDVLFSDEHAFEPYPRTAPQDLPRRAGRTPGQQHL